MNRELVYMGCLFVCVLFEAVSHNILWGMWVVGRQYSCNLFFQLLKGKMMQGDK